MNQDNCLQLMNHLIVQMEGINYSAVLLAAQEKHGLRQLKISKINPTQAYQIYRPLYDKFNDNPAPQTELNWWDNELKIFTWVLISYMQLKRLSVQQLGTSDWPFFSKLFPNKKEILFEYQSLALLKEGSLINKWTPEQDQLFSKLISDSHHKCKWSEYAKQLYIQSNKKYFKTAKQCRQRWLNHLDPTKSKEDWQPRQDYILIAHVHNKGKKWAQIAKMLKNRRTQHSIKNRHKSLINKEQKLHSDKLEEEELIKHIYSKYEAEFATGIFSKKSFEQIQGKLQKHSQLGLSSVNILPTYNKQVFQIGSSSVLKPHLKQPPKDGISFEPTNNYPIQYRQYLIPSLSQNSIQSYQLADRSQFEKQIRADMFLSLDPFYFLKRFFRSKDSITQE